MPSVHAHLLDRQTLLFILRMALWGESLAIAAASANISNRCSSSMYAHVHAYRETGRRGGHIYL